MFTKITERLALLKSRLFSRTWWKDAAARAVYTVAAVVTPYIGGSLIADIPWLTIVSAGALGFIASIATSLAGLPETEGVDLPWWLAALERTVKTFFQALAAGIAPAILFTEVDWSTIAQASAIAAGLSLLRLVLATLPFDPSAARADQIVLNQVVAPEADTVTVLAAEPKG
jgi:hypothetical protein